jgi:GDP-mannose transporter
MSDKKNEDFAVQMPEIEKFGEEKDPFLSGTSPHHRSRLDGALTASISKIDNSPGASILAYCLSSISMTVVNKFVVSGSYWNLNFFYLAVQVRQPSQQKLSEALTSARPSCA